MITKYYRVERITHRPLDEDKITIVREVKERDLQLARILATQFYLEELQKLDGNYSPANFNSYDINKGTGYNCQLLFLDVNNEKTYVVESSMTQFEPTLADQKSEEKRIFQDLGLDYRNFEV